MESGAAGCSQTARWAPTLASCGASRCVAAQQTIDGAEHSGERPASHCIASLPQVIVDVRAVAQDRLAGTALEDDRGDERLRVLGARTPGDRGGPGAQSELPGP